MCEIKNISEEDLKYINNKIQGAKDIGYFRVVDLLSKIKYAINEDNKEDMISILWELVDYITIY